VRAAIRDVVVPNLSNAHISLFKLVLEQAGSLLSNTMLKDGQSVLTALQSKYSSAPDGLSMMVMIMDALDQSHTHASELAALLSTSLDRCSLQLSQLPSSDQACFILFLVARHASDQLPAICSDLSLSDLEFISCTKDPLNFPSILRSAYSRDTGLESWCSNIAVDASYAFGRQRGNQYCSKAAQFFSSLCGMALNIRILSIICKFELRYDCAFFTSILCADACFSRHITSFVTVLSSGSSASCC